MRQNYRLFTTTSTEALEQFKSKFYKVTKPSSNCSACHYILHTSHSRFQQDLLLTSLWLELWMAPCLCIFENVSWTDVVSNRLWQCWLIAFDPAATTCDIRQTRCVCIFVCLILPESRTLCQNLLSQLVQTSSKTTFVQTVFLLSGTSNKLNYF